MRRLTPAGLVAVVALVVAGCGSSPHGLSVRIEHDPLRITVRNDGRTVVAEDAQARLRYLANGHLWSLTKVTAAHGNVFDVATSEPGRTATVAVTAIRHGYRIAVRLRPATGVTAMYDAFGTGPDDHFLGGGERGGGVDLRGQVLPVEVSYVCSSAPVPFFSSTAGWALRLDSQRIAGLAFPGSPGGSGCQFGAASPCVFPALTDRVEVCVEGARLDEDVYVGGLAATLADYQAATGPPRVPAPSELALIKWRDVYDRGAELTGDLLRLRAAGVPVGWMLLDNPWETCVGSLEFAPTLVPHPAALIRRIHALGARFMLWISPKVMCGDQGYAPSQLLGPPDHQVLDFRQPAVVAKYRSRLRKLVALGVDGFKGDRGDELDLTALDPTLQNDYPLLYANAALPTLRPGGGAIFRAATVGSQAVLPGMWGGDQPGEFDGLRTAIVLGQTAAMSGFPTWGSDVGGYSSAGLTAEVFARWAQLGAVSPIMEVGGAGPNSTPWVLGPDAMEALRAAAVLHYELFPAFYALLRRGAPVLRPLGYSFPADAQAWANPFEFTVGPDLLAAPVTGGGTTPHVYLPAGGWIDLYTAQTVTGPSGFTRKTPLDQLPLYLRAGAVVPFNLRTATGSWWGLDELTHPGRAGFLVADGATLALHGQPHDVQLFVPAAARPQRVTLRAREVGWAWNAGPMPGVVVRVHGPEIEGKLVLSGP
jgi:alpha-D-xyloside xylohydrolase